MSKAIGNFRKEIKKILEEHYKKCLSEAIKRGIRESRKRKSAKLDCKEL